MEKINIEHRHDFVEWVIIEALAELSQLDMPKDLSSLDIEMKVNGVVVPVIETLGLIEKQIDRMVLEKAKDLVGEKLDGLEEKIHRVACAIDESFGDFLVQEE